VTLEQLGWNSFFQKQLNGSLAPARVPARVMEHVRSNIYRVHTGLEESPATLPGAFRHNAATRGELPAVGDWVGVRDTVIEHLFTRQSVFSRQAAGAVVAEQVIAANVDVVLVMTSLNRDLNLARLERYLASVWAGGAMPVVLLSKSDLVDAHTAEEAIADVAAIAPGVTVLAVSATERSDGEGRSLSDTLAPLLRPGRTLALVGSSGVGKSTLTNVLLGRDEQAVTPIRDGDDRGRHTTVSRRLIPLGDYGALLLDTPGMRELQIWDGDGLAQAFPEIETLAAECRFRDCRHEGEPGCAVRQALDDERLDARRMESFRKLEREQHFAAVKQDAALRAEQKKRWKSMHKAIRRMYEERDKPK